MADLIAKIKLADGSELPVGKHFITSVESVSQSTPDAGSVNYGIIANSGSMEIQDGNGYISDLIDNGLLPISNLDVKLEVDGKVIQEHITTDSDYDTEDNNLSISLSNFIKDFDILKYKGYAYPETSKKLYDLFYDVLYSYYYTQYPSETYPTFIDNMFESSVLTYIKAIDIKYPVIEYGKTYREILNDLCTIAQLNMFADANNKPKFVSARPVYTAFDEVKELKWKNIVDSLKYTRFLKNKFDGVEMNKTQVVDTIRFNDVVFTSDNIDSTSISPVMGVTAFNSDDSGGRSYDLKTMSLPAMSAISVVRVKNYYIEGSVSFNKKNSNNTEQINNVSNNAFNADDSPRFEIHYDIKGDEPITGKIDASTGLATQLTIDNTFKREGSGYLSQTFSYEYQNTRLTDTITASATVNAKDQSSYTVSYDSLNKKYTINFKILCGQDLVYLGGGVDRDVDTTVDKIIDCTGKNVRYMPKYIKFSVYGDKRIITFTEISASTEGIENCKTKASVSSSNLLQNTATYDNKEIAEVIKENILNDYRNGIADATMSLNADITDIGELVKYPEDNRVWKVVEKDFRYDGDYNYPLKLMQCYKPYSKYGLFDDNDETIYTWQELIDNNMITVNSDNQITASNITNYGFLKISDSIKSVANNVFKNSTYLTGIDTGDGIESIGNDSFSGCSNLKTIIIGQNVSQLGYRAFQNCAFADKIIYNAKSITTISNKDCFSGIGSSVSKGTELIIGKYVTMIPSGFCYYYSSTVPNITSIIFEQNSLCEKIGENAFAYTNIKNIIIPNSVTTIDAMAFRFCSQLENVTLSNNLQALSSSLFYNCTELKELYIPQSVKTISNCLQGCNKIYKLTFPMPKKDGGILFYLYEFFGVYSNSNIPNSLYYVNVNSGESTVLGYQFFKDCSHVGEVTIGSGINQISNNAFENATGLYRVYFEDETGWKVNQNDMDVSNSQQNANNLTSTYMSDTWIKS